MPAPCRQASNRKETRTMKLRNKFRTAALCLTAAALAALPVTASAATCRTASWWHCSDDARPMLWRYCNSYTCMYAPSGFCSLPQTQTPICGGAQQEEPQAGPQDQQQNIQQNEQQNQQGTQQNTGSASQVQEILALVNQERAAFGLKALTLHEGARSVAQLKAEDMAENGYFSHTSPTYGSAFDMLSERGIAYTSAGENIAAGQKTAAAVMNSWMNSSGHRANILNSQYTSLGVGYAVSAGGKPYWVQVFLTERR